MRHSLLALLALPAILLASATSSAASMAQCEIPLVDPEFKSKPGFDALKVVSITFEKGLSASKMAAAIKELRAEGFEGLGSAERGRAWVGEVDPIRASQLSRVDGVESIIRGSWNGIEVWRDGKKSSRVTPESVEPATDEELWNTLRKPIRGTPPRDLPTIRKMAREKGVTIVLSDNRPTDERSVAEMEELWGARLFFAGDLAVDTAIVKLPGVVIHIEPDPKALAVRGDLSVTLGQGRMMEHLNKVTEAEWVHSIDPEAMSPTSRGSELLGSKTPALGLHREVTQFLTHPNADRLKDIQAREHEFLDGVVAAAKKRFPPGAFFKNKFDYATRESGGIINTMSLDTAQMSREYTAALLSFTSETRPGHRDLAEFETWLRDSGSALATMGHNLLMNPDDVLVQQKLDIAKTAGDSLMEFRVDVFEGHVVNASFRYGLEYHPEESKGAAKMAQRFFDGAPDKDRYFTGGLDVAMQNDGSFKIIETNPGSQSAFIDSSGYPISANEALSHFLGHRTPLMQKLESAYSKGKVGLGQFLRGLNLHEAEEKHAIRQMSRFDVLTWVRDKYLAEWSEQPTPKHRRELLRRMREVASAGGEPDDQDFEYYIIGRMKEAMH